MAATGFDFRFPTLKHNYDPSSSIVMDKNCIDLNRHAIDLNEVPPSELGVDLLGGHVEGSSEKLGNSMQLPRKGGWLELFRNMFGHDNSSLDSLPFASCTSMLNSRFINHMPLRAADGILQQNAPRSLDSPCLNTRWKTHDGHDGIANADAAMSNAVELFTFDEFGYAKAMIALPSFNHPGMSGSHESSEFFISSVQSGCASSTLPSLFSGLECQLNTRTGAWECNEEMPYNSGGSCANHDQLYVCSNFSSSFDQCKASTPAWDLTSQHLPQCSAEFQPRRHPEMSCIMNPDLFTQMHVMNKMENFSLPARASEGSYMEPDNDRRASAACLKAKDSTCLSKKGNDGSDTEELQELGNIEDTPALSEDKEKGQDLRIRIIASPKWLPPGWITEVKTRMAGSTAGTTDKYYKDPGTGRRFRSKNEVLSFLQTGRLCRSKPFKLCEDVTSRPSFLPSPDQSLCLDSAQLPIDRTVHKTSARDHGSQASACPSLCPANFILDKVNMNMMQEPFLNTSSNVSETLCINNREDGSGSFAMESNGVGNSHLSFAPGILSLSMHNESVHRHKRKIAEDFFSAASCKRLHGSLPRLTQRQHPKGSQDEVGTNHLLLRYKANVEVPGLYDSSMLRIAPKLNLYSTKELQRRTSSAVKVSERKFVKITRKQGRDLLVSLGRKLCLDFLGAAKVSSLQSIEGLNL